MYVDDDAHLTGIPHVYTILFFIIILSALATWIIPAGQFERALNEAQGLIIVPGTYKAVTPSPAGFMDTLTTIYRGMVSAADTVFFVFIAFSSISLIVATGAFHALIAAILGYFKGRAQILIIPLFITLIGMASSTIAVSEEMFPFIPIFVAVSIAMKYDALVGMSIVALGIGLGYSGSFLNPFTIGLAQNMAGLPPFSGAGYRIFCHLSTVVVASIYVMTYAVSVSHSQKNSLLYGCEQNGPDFGGKAIDEHPLHIRHVLVLAVTLTGIAAIIWGVYKKEWYFEQLTAVYLCMSISSGLIMGWSADKIAHKWANGAAQITSTCLKIALAKGIILILQNALILDTIIYWTARPLLELPRWGGALAMLFIQTIINFFVPSGSGQAVVSMPLMIPISDILNISRQTAVLAFQFGDGISNILWITGSMPVICNFAKVPPRKWLRWFFPLFALIFVTQMICIVGALLINY
ncbi:MAG: TIGR00366 family protein [Synergistaceae bacterium]|jgi:uncharacterized ion transporter superfamily protein YfcC|nr:TIGR00366 family protein [Synergistaceae bacterium]